MRQSLLRILCILLLLLVSSIGCIITLLSVPFSRAYLLNTLQPATPTPLPTPVPLILTPLPSPTPVLTAKDAPPVITSEVAYLLDMDTGNVLVDINGEKPRPMASTTKIMTALIAIQTGNLDQLVPI